MALVIVGCSSVQSPFGRIKKVGKNPVDRGKLGVKRSLLTDKRGVPLGIVIAPANWHDATVFVQTIQSIPIERPSPSHSNPQHMCLDKGYDADWIRIALSVLGFIPHIPQREYQSRNVQLRKKKHPARRWVVERSHSWLNRYRAILIRWEKKPKHYRALLHIAAGVICFKRAGIR